jgi:hypothetical protein
MRDMIRGIRNFGIYLLPISLLATASTLLMALLCYPAPSVAPATQPHTAPVAETPYGRTHAEALFAARPAMLWAPPLFRKDADSSGPVLIRL